MNETDKALVNMTFEDLKEKMTDEMLETLEFKINVYLMEKFNNEDITEMMQEDDKRELSKSQQRRLAAQQNLNNYVDDDETPPWDVM